jgi:hypothetical protein
VDFPVPRASWLVLTVLLALNPRIERKKGPVGKRKSHRCLLLTKFTIC